MSNVVVEVLKPQIKRQKRKIPIKARGSSLKKGGHKPLHFDELPTKAESNCGLPGGVVWVEANPKNVMRWQSNREGAAEIYDGEKHLMALPLSGNTHKSLKELFEFLRFSNDNKLMMRHAK